MFIYMDTCINDIMAKTKVIFRGKTRVVGNVRVITVPSRYFTDEALQSDAEYWVTISDTRNGNGNGVRY